MYRFDLYSEPPTTHDLNAAASHIRSQRRRLIKVSCVSDAIHILLLAGLYFAGILSGAAITVTVVLGLVVAVVLAAATRDHLLFSDILAIAAVIVGCVAAVITLLAVGMSQGWGTSILAGGIAGSIVLTGTLIGRRIKTVLLSLELLETIPYDDPATEELAWLCRQHPLLRDYREQAARNLRPHLTYGELAAMRHWHQTQRAPTEP